MPELLDDALACVGERLADRLELLPLEPGLPGQLRRRLPHRRAHRSRPDGRRDRPGRLRPGRGRLPQDGGLPAHPVPGGARQLHRPQPGLAAGPDRQRRHPAGRARRPAPAVAQDRAVPHRRAAAADLLLPGHVRRPGTAGRAGDLRGDLLHGHRRRASTSRAAACTPSRAPWPRRPPMPESPFTTRHEVERIEVSGGRARAVHTSDGRRFAADVVVVNADLPTAYEQLLPAEYRPRRLARLRYSPSCVLVHAGSSHRLPGPRPPLDLLRRGLARDVRRDHRPRPADERPVLPGQLAQPDRPVAGARRTGQLLRAVPHPQHPGRRSTGRPSDRATATRSWPPWTGAACPASSRASRSRRW